MEVTLIEAWIHWKEGLLQPNFLLWGHQILWWGRIGKIIQFIAVISIVAEIIGPNKIRDFGNSLHGTFTLKTAKTYFSDIWNFLCLFIKSIFLHKEEYQNAYQEAKKYVSSSIHKLSIPLFILVSGIYLWHKLDWWQIILAMAFIVYAAVYFALPIAIVFITCFVICGLMFNYFFFRPIAFVLDQDQLERIIKVISLFMLIVGFHFDMLAS